MGDRCSYKEKKKLVFNARSESLNSKILFRNCKRCIFIANGYFEWKQESNKKYPYFFYFERKIMFFAGIYNNNGCSIVTKDSHKSIAHIHSRQPFIIEEKKVEDWIRKKTIYPSAIDQAIMFHKVSFDVNLIKNNTKNNIKKCKN